MKFITLAFLLISSTISFANDDLLDKQVLTIKSDRFGDVFDLTAQNLKNVFSRYKIVLGSGFSIVKPLVVSGTQANPNITATLKKCVAFVCRDVAVDADLTVNKVQGACDENYYLKADLQRSGDMLTNVYDYFYSNICAKKTAEGAEVTIISYAARARTYNGGPIASTIQSFLRLQIDPIMASLQVELNKNIKVVDGQ